MIHEADGSGRVSVIMPIFNTPKSFLIEAVSSVLAQSYENWELLLVDDGSDSTCSEIAQGLANENDQKIRYLHHTHHRNLGSSRSRNLGLRLATGEYIAFLDSDDIWTANKLKRQVELMNCQPDAAMVFGRTFCWYSWSGKPADIDKDFYPNIGLRTPQLIQPPKLLQLTLQDRISVPSLSHMMVRKAVIDFVGGFENGFTGLYDDQVLYAKIWLTHSVYLVDECWGSYRRHAGSMTGAIQSSARMELARLAYLSWLTRHLADKGFEGSPIWQVLQRELKVYEALKLAPYIRKIRRMFWKLINRLTRR